MVDPPDLPLRLRRPEPEAAAGIERLLRQVPCPFVGPLRFTVWQADRQSQDRQSEGRQSQDRQAEGRQSQDRQAQDRPAEDADASRSVLAGPVRPDLAVAVELPGLAGAQPDQLLAGLAELARTLGADQPAGGPFVDEAGWWIRAAGSEWFVTVHADCYPIRHSRHWARPGAVIVLVPRLAFDQGFPAGVPDSTRQAIRLAFSRKGIGYPTGGGAIAHG